jgi:hypothetical protein
MKNTGGRNKFERDSVVRYITVQGGISDDEYTIDPESQSEVVVADRKGLVTICKKDKSETLRVQSRRLLPSGSGSQVPVIESNNKYRAVCDNCLNVLEISGASDNVQCDRCDKQLLLLWTGDKPMSDAVETTTESKIVNKKTKSTKPKAEKKMSKPATGQEPTKINLFEMAKSSNLELWTKRSVKFDHVEVDVQAHALLFIGDNPRKLCFNTYDGTLGKKTKSLPVEQFIKDEEVITDKKPAHKPWFPIKDLEKARVQLKKNGYELS